MQKNDQKPTIDQERSQLQAEIVSKYLKKGESRPFFKCRDFKAKAYFNFYTPTERTNMVESHEFEESSRLLLDVRDQDLRNCLDTIFRGIYIYLEKKSATKGSSVLLERRAERIARVIQGLVATITAMTKADIVLDPNWRGTMGAFFTVGVEIEFNGVDIDFNFSASIGVSHFMDENLVPLHDGNIENSPRIYNGLNFKTKITDWIK